MTRHRGAFQEPENAKFKQESLRNQPPRAVFVDELLVEHCKSIDNLLSLASPSIEAVKRKNVSLHPVGSLADLIGERACDMMSADT